MQKKQCRMNERKSREAEMNQRKKIKLQQTMSKKYGVKKKSTSKPNTPQWTSLYDDEDKEASIEKDRS